MDEKLIVYKATGLVLSKSDLDILETRLFDLILGKMNQELDISPDIEYQIDVSDFANRYNLDPSWAYQELKLGFKGLMKKSFSIPANLLNKSEKSGTIIESNWLQHIIYNDSERLMRVKFTEITAKLVSKLDKKKGYLKFNLDSKKFISSSYHSKIYDLLRNNLNRRIYFINLDEFRRILNIENKYKNFAQLREYILEPALKTINETTDIKVEYISNKLGTRAVRQLTFTIERIL